MANKTTDPYETPNVCSQEDNVVPFTGRTTLDISVADVLDGAKDQLDKTEPMLIIGCDSSEDDLLYFASSVGGTAELLLLLERAKQVLLDY